MTNFPTDLDTNDELSKEAHETFTRHFAAVVRRGPERTAFKLKTPGGYASISYGEAYRRIRGTALGLHILGVRRGERIAILSENRPEWAIAYFGSYFAGTVAVPLDTQISPEEWRRLIDNSEARAVFVSGMLAARLIAALDGAGIPNERIIIFDDSEAAKNDGCGSFDEIIESALRDENPPEIMESAPSDVVVIIYTSGTVGNPKGVPLTHANIMHELRSIFGVIHITSDDAFICLLPLQHVFASIINVLLPLYKGGYVVFADTLKRAEIMQALSEAGITILATVPQFFYMFHNRIQEELSRRPAFARRAFRGMLALNRLSLRYLKLNAGKMFFAKVHKSFGARLRLFFSGGSGLDIAVERDFHNMGFTILQGYGLTETTGACTVNSVKTNAIGSVGRAIPGMDIKILSPDETGVGEVLIRGPVVADGYYKNPEATSQSMRGGWFHSGDLGRLDEKGNLFITGREKEVIVLANGKNLYPDELETHYLQCPYIQEIAVVGVQGDDGRGEKPHAVVVPNFGHLKSKKISNAREALRDEIAALSGRLPKYKRLMSYQIQAEPLPRTTTKKLRRLEIKRLAESGDKGAPAQAAVSAEDQAIMDSAAGREIIDCMRKAHHRDEAIAPDMNLELDLGFDSMERVELLSGLEERLDVRLSDDDAAEIFTVRDLIARLEREAGGAANAAAARRSWKELLSESPGNGEPVFSPSGTAASVLKYIVLKTLYYGLFKPLLRLKTGGLENLPEKGPYLICPNHQSYIDPFVLIAALPFRVFSRMFFVGYSAFFTGPVMKIAARILNIIPVDPDTHLLGAMKAGAAGLRRGGILCIFPEGGRSFDGELTEFKKGAAILARELSVPVVPAAIAGAYEVWPRGSGRIRPRKVRVAFGEAFMPAESPKSDPYPEDSERLRQLVGRLFDDLRSLKK
ncbi:MAG: AMP-binding protein [Acidobacteriota bacterium]|jgi:long-chain acyl-CoA synthetase|nr:AMP-binding protein [Acidobacteriota bacterium]